MSTLSVNEVACPECGANLKLENVPHTRNRVQALCNHGDPARPMRAVYEADGHIKAEEPAEEPNFAAAPKAEPKPGGGVQVLPEPGVAPSEPGPAEGPTPAKKGSK